MDDETFVLLEGLAKNLDKYFPELVQRYQNILYSFAFRLSNRAQDAEDIVQEALMRGYIVLSQYPGERLRALNLRPWLYKLTLNVFYNSQRRSRLLTFSLDSPEENGVLEVPDDEAIQPEIWYDLQERRQELERALYLLTECYRETIICVYFEQLSYQETATLLDISLGTVRSRLNRGLKALRGILYAERTKSYGTA